MPRRWRGVLAIEGEQTGDGRLISENALTWAELPLPLGWLQQEQHGDLLAGAVNVGNIDTISRDGNDIVGGGVIDDAEGSAGAELIGRMTDGTAAMGNRIGLSIDPDNFALQVVDNTGGEGGDVIIMASASPLPTAAEVALQLSAAAGDPDPTDAPVLFEDTVDSVLMRFTSLRIRGVTACAIPAFAGAYMELDDSAAAEAPAEADAPQQIAAAAAPVAPPSAWFGAEEPDIDSELWVEQVDGSVAVPLQITDDGHVFGHLARWGQCHTGYAGSCVSPPDSMRAYADFMVGEVVCADGQRIATGTLTVGCDHAAAHLLAPAARDHYANTGLAWADVRVSSGAAGCWVSGSLRPGLTEDVVRVLRASSLSGDWRQIGGHLELIAALSVNSPGFPIQREPVVPLAASAAGSENWLVTLGDVRATVGITDGEQLSLVAAGTVTRCAECAERSRVRSNLSIGVSLADESVRLLEAVSRHLAVIERRTRHLVPAAAEAALTRIRR